MPRYYVWAKDDTDSEAEAFVTNTDSAKQAAFDFCEATIGLDDAFEAEVVVRDEDGVERMFAVESHSSHIDGTANVDVVELI